MTLRELRDKINKLEEEGKDIDQEAIIHICPAFIEPVDVEVHLNDHGRLETGSYSYDKL